ncbi:SDR family oxidoreductase [Nisaea acidiphila]|uniref:SDR family oxidoreductase n=1 Tax=Nisaea acidiphila TaxID=1862145 RepID=A0A9J7ARB2_9PROT|nr:SDR family NAD(P)-dependent oxidoreductase [Nisaea acidiphila]UUX49783.1 SDR family oxidoreductase [Nisaea acidiphila]
MKDGEFTDRAAIVTGGAKGIGLAVAKRILENGGKVALWDVDDEGLAARVSELGSPPGLVATTVDVSSEASVSVAHANTVGAIGPIDLLVNSAGIIGPTVPTVSYALPDWKKVIDIDLTGVFLCSKTIAPGMAERGFGRIVNIASIAGKEGTANAPAYSAAKAGVIAFTKAMSKEMLNTGVLINCIAPGPIETEMVANADPKHVEIMILKCPMARLGTAEEVAAMTCWLLSEECSFNSGACFDLSGGRAVY